MTETSVNKAQLRAIAPQFVVADVVKAAEYYRDVLGFQILGYFLDPPVFAIVSRDGVELQFGKSDQGVVSPNVRRRRGGLDAYLWVTDVDTLHEEFKAQGANIIEGPVDQVYGSREIVVEDCYGYRLAFAT